MKIAVCIKQVVTREWQLRVNDQKTWIRDQDASFELNEPDAYALEEALRLKEKHGGEVIVCSAGPARATQVIREALARGADRAIHVESDALATADANAVAEALAEAIKAEQVDLVLTGLQSDDQGFGQVGVVLAEKLGMPHATIIMEVQKSDGPALAGEARARRRLVPVGRAADARAADDPERHQPAALRDPQGDHGGEEERDQEGRAGRGRAAGAADRQHLLPREGQEDPDAAGRAGRGREGAGQAAPRRSEGAVILVIAEHRDGKLNRATLETIAAAQTGRRPGEDRRPRLRRRRDRRARSPPRTPPK